MNINVNYIHVNVPNNIQSSYIITHTNSHINYRKKCEV